MTDLSRSFRSRVWWPPADALSAGRQRTYSLSAWCVQALTRADMEARNAKHFGALLRAGRWFGGLPEELQRELLGAGVVRVFGRVNGSFLEAISQVASTRCSKGVSGSRRRRRTAARCS